LIVAIGGGVDVRAGGSGVADGPVRRPKIVDVAKAAGVSPTTVSHALNRRGQVDPRTRERVIEVARRLGYRPHLGAQRLRTGAVRQIGLISSMPFAIAGGPSRLGFFMEVASSAAETALTSGYALVLVPPLDTLPSLDELDIGGAVVVEPQRDDEVTQRLVERGVPVVAIGEQPGPGPRLPYVQLHADYCARLLLEHLEERGARNVVLMVGAQPRESALAAQREYDALISRSDMAHRLVLVDEAEGEEGAHRRMTELLERSPQVDGVCAMVDTFATGVIRAIRESGRSVPGDVRVVTRYDGIRARTSEPQLTAVDLHLDETAAAAVELLLRVLSGEDTAAPAEVALPVLVPRASSAVVTPLAR
jgi:DNA-binding LacI/PurR family transcriptional regulator